jgi:hypothetical protein
MITSTYANDFTLNGIFMRTRRGALLIALLTGAVVGIAYPYLDLALACRVPDSEACVWGKAYFPLTLTLSVVMLGGIATGLAYAALMWRRNKKERDNAA